MKQDRKQTIRQIRAKRVQIINKNKAKPIKNRPTIAIVVPQARRLVGSLYKYSELLKYIGDVVIIRNVGHRKTIEILNKLSPDFYFVMGDRYSEFSIIQSIDKPYYLIEQDVSSLRCNFYPLEKNMIESAKGIIFTSPIHELYIRKNYNFITNTALIPLMPLKRNIIKTNPKKLNRAKTLVYSGSFLHQNRLESDYGYRCYLNLFLKFKKAGWKIHLYPSYDIDISVITQYQSIGCVVYDHLPHNLLYKELSKYPVGLHGYFKEGVPKKAFDYTQLCLPNKTFDYLASNTWTLSYNGGYSGKFIQQGNFGEIITDETNLRKIKPKPVKDNDRFIIDSEENIIKLKQMMGIQ